MLNNQGTLSELHPIFLDKGIMVRSKRLFGSDRSANVERVLQWNTRTL
jgi:hypothetical protein